MIRTFIFAAAFFVATPVLAQEAREHETHDHEVDDHAAHEHDDAGASESADETVAGAPIFHTPEIDAALAAGGEPAVVDVLGAVCDFCAKAMNKTFGKRDEVAATYVDLDSKTLSLVFQPAMTLSDDAIRELVKKAGYKTAAIRRGPAALNGEDDASDRS